MHLPLREHFSAGTFGVQEKDDLLMFCSLSQTRCQTSGGTSHFPLAADLIGIREIIVRAKFILQWSIFEFSSSGWVNASWQTGAEHYILGIQASIGMHSGYVSWVAGLGPCGTCPMNIRQSDDQDNR